MTQRRMHLVAYLKTGPVRLLHGSVDKDVPWQQGVRLIDCLEGDVNFTLVKGSDHRMSSPADLKRIEETLEALLKELL